MKKTLLFTLTAVFVLAVANVSVVDGKGGGKGDSSSGEGDLRVYVKIYDRYGNLTDEKIDGLKVKLYKKNGKREDSDKTNFKGEANFRDIDEGKYRVKCEAPGMVNLNEPHKDYYRTGLVKIKDDERAYKTCHLKRTK